MPTLKNDALAVKLGTTDVSAIYARNEKVWPIGPSNIIATFTLISASGSIAVYECRDASGNLCESQEVYIKKYNPANYLVTKDLVMAWDGIVTITNPLIYCNTYRPEDIAGSVWGEWIGLPTSGGRIITGPSGSPTKRAIDIDADTDIIEYLGPPDFFYDELTASLGFGSKWNATVLLENPAVASIQDPDPSMGVWRGSNPGSWWHGGISGATYAFMHRFSAEPYLGMSALTEYLGIGEFPDAAGDVPFFISEASGQCLWLCVKGVSTPDWPSSSGYMVFNAISEFGFQDCVWTPPAKELITVRK